MSQGGDVDSYGGYNIHRDRAGSHRLDPKISIRPLDIAEGGEAMDVLTPFTGIEEEEEEDEIQTCEGFVCQSNGTCAIVEDKASCLCPLGHFGPRCEQGQFF